MVTSATLRLDPADLAVIAARVPHQEALRHKRRGVWFTWSWSDLVTGSARLAEALLARGIGAGSLVAVSGDYGPNLVLFAIAAVSVGARVATLPTGITRAALADWLTRESPDLVFLGQRDQIGIWRAALRKAGRQAALVVDFHLPWGHPSAAGYTFAADLLGDAAGGTVARRLTPGVLWIEESTDWPDGLSCILHAAIASGRSLAFQLLASRRGALGEAFAPSLHILRRSRHASADAPLRPGCAAARETARFRPTHTRLTTTGETTCRTRASTAPASGSRRPAAAHR
jgi:hypothetical protein